MTAVSGSPAGRSAAPLPVGRPGRLGVRTRRAVLITHIASAGAWLGIDVAMAVVIGTAMATDDLLTRAVCLQALEVFVVWPLLVSGLVCLLTGATLGLGSRWGLVRYWWVAAKLALNLLLTALVPVALWPEITSQAEAARRVLSGEAVEFDLSNLIYPPIVSPVALLIAMTLSVVKPWGLIRRRRRDSRPATPASAEQQEKP